MSNKEKRIIVAETNAICKALNIFSEKDSMFCCRSGEWIPITTENCTKCKNPIILGISRAEAVDRKWRGLFAKFLAIASIMCVVIVRSI